MGFLDEVHEHEAKLPPTPVIDAEAVAAAESRRNQEESSELIADFLVAVKERGVRPYATWHPRSYTHQTGLTGWNLSGLFRQYIIADDGQPFQAETSSTYRMKPVPFIPLKVSGYGDTFLLKDELMKILFR